MESDAVADQPRLPASGWPTVVTLDGRRKSVCPSAVTVSRWSFCTDSASAVARTCGCSTGWRGWGFLVVALDAAGHGGAPNLPAAPPKFALPRRAGLAHPGCARHRQSGLHGPLDGRSHDHPAAGGSSRRRSACRGTAGHLAKKKKKKKKTPAAARGTVAMTPSARTRRRVFFLSTVAPRTASHGSARAFEKRHAAPGAKSIPAADDVGVGAMCAPAWISGAFRAIIASGRLHAHVGGDAQTPGADDRRCGERIRSFRSKRARQPTLPTGCAVPGPGAYHSWMLANPRRRRHGAPTGGCRTGRRCTRICTGAWRQGCVTCWADALLVRRLHPLRRLGVTAHLNVVGTEAPERVSLDHLRTGPCRAKSRAPQGGGRRGWLRARRRVRPGVRRAGTPSRRPPRRGRCCAAGRRSTLSTWRLSAVPRSCHVSSAHWARPVAPSGWPLEISPPDGLTTHRPP